jgi:hypothetical protein
VRDAGRKSLGTESEIRAHEPRATGEERGLVRELALRVAEAAALPVQAERERMWRGLNALHPDRAMVLLDPQNGWEDLVPEDSLRCADLELRGVERQLRRKLFRAECIPDDCPITAAFDVGWKIDATGWGVEETYARTSARGAFGWDPPLKSTADLQRLRPASYSVDRAASDARLSYWQEMLGDILPVARGGVGFCRCGLTRKLIMLRGLDAFLLDLYDAPTFVHELMSFIANEMAKELDFYERERLLRRNLGPEDWTGSGGLAAMDAGSVSAVGATLADGAVRTRDMFAWGESQETVGVGPEQFREFVLAYQLPILGRFGLVDYGCCEALDSRLDLLIASLPRLRWVAVSPWADRALAADKLGSRYVYCAKPQPALICRENPDWAGAERELRETLAVARGCCVSLVMKDTTSFFGEPARATRWAEMARRVAEERA